MFRISKLADYSTVVMAYLARRPDVLHNARDITDHTHIALPTVSKILKLLARGELLTSHRGMNGGYSLARPAEEISIAAIIKAIEGDLGLTECAYQESHCSIESLCSIRSNWQFISQVVGDALEQVTLAQLISRTPMDFNFNINEPNEKQLDKSS